MSWFGAVAFLLVASGVVGCASVENANMGGGRDLSVAGMDGDMAVGASDPDLALPSDGGLTLPSCPNGKHVVVNEVRAGGTASAGDEFIELFNPCTIDLDLTGSTIVYRSAAGTADVNPPIVTLTKTITAGGYLLIANTSFTGTGTPDQTYAGSGRLAAAGGGVGLRDPSGTLVDSVGYGTATNALVEGAAAPAPPDGQSIARIPNGVDSNHNNLDFSVATTSTPRAAN
jgi:hypothetical protein